MVLGAQKFPPRWNFTVCKKKASVGGSLLWSFGWSYADALAEAGSGKTCAVDVQAADACHVVSASFVWGGQKNRATLWRPLNASLGKIARLICCCLHKIIA